jgi:hypothetical protein
MSATSDGKEIDRVNNIDGELQPQADWLRRLVQALMMIYLLPAIILVLAVGTLLAGLLATCTMVSRAAKWLSTHSRFPNELPFRPMGSPNSRVNRPEGSVPNKRIQSRESKSL